MPCLDGGSLLELRMLGSPFFYCCGDCTPSGQGRKVCWVHLANRLRTYRIAMPCQSVYTENPVVIPIHWIPFLWLKVQPSECPVRTTDKVPQGNLAAKSWLGRLGMAWALIHLIHASCLPTCVHQLRSLTDQSGSITEAAWQLMVRSSEVCEGRTTNATERPSPSMPGTRNTSTTKYSTRLANGQRGNGWRISLIFDQHKDGSSSASSLNEPTFWSLHRNALRDPPLRDRMQIMIKSL